METNPLTIREHYYRLMENKYEAAAWNIIHEFYDYFGENGADQRLWDMTLAAIGSEDLNDLQTERHNILYFYEHAKILLEAVHLLYKQHKAECCNLVFAER